MIFYYITDRKKLDKFMLPRRAIIKEASLINFLQRDEIDLIKAFYAKYGKEELEILYRKIGIEFNTITNQLGFYTLGDIELSPSDLATSERNMLYTILCKALNKKTLIIGLLEVLDVNQRKRLLNEVKGSTDQVEVLVMDRYNKEYCDGFEWRWE